MYISLLPKVKILMSVGNLQCLGSIFIPLDHKTFESPCLTTHYLQVVNKQAYLVARPAVIMAGRFALNVT